MSDRPSYFRALIPDNRRRASWHDYKSVCIYMFTISKKEGAPDFGRLVIEHPLTDSWVELLPVGLIIEGCIKKISILHPLVRVLQYIIMPDHIHLILHVRSVLDRSVGCIIGGFKTGVTQEYGERMGKVGCSLFEAGFHDRILRHRNQLESMYNYIRSNPYRLAVRVYNPGFFRRIHSLDINGSVCSGYGNPLLLDNPYKSQVLVHRSDSDIEFEEKRKRWLYVAANGGVLVSPFISPREKLIKKEAEEAGGRIILITNKEMGTHYKPALHEFNLCAEGRALVIAHARSMDFGRQACLDMNELARAVVAVSNIC